MKDLCKALLCGAVLVLGGCATNVDSMRQSPERGDSPLMAQLEKNAKYTLPNLVIAVGECNDKTGQYKDGDMLRYSRSVTQACSEVLGNILQKAGFIVVDRDQQVLKMLATEYQMSNNLVNGQDGKPMNIGLVQKNRPTAGLLGTGLIWSGAISSFASSVSSGGGGVEILGAGVNYQQVNAQVAVITRVTSMDSVIIDTEQTRTRVVGSKTGFTLTRIVKLFGGDTFFNIEAGIAEQMPVDLAFEDALIANVAAILEKNKGTFYKKEDLEKVSFNMQMPAVAAAQAPKKEVSARQ